MKNLRRLLPDLAAAIEGRLEIINIARVTKSLPKEIKKGYAPIEHAPLPESIKQLFGILLHVRRDPRAMQVVQAVLTYAVVEHCKLKPGIRLDVLFYGDWQVAVEVQVQAGPAAEPAVPPPGTQVH